MQAGTFEMERIGQRAPEERTIVAPPAEMPVAPLQIEEEEEVDSVVEEEDAGDESEIAQAPPRSEAPANGEAPAGEGGRRRRRRRRRGRDRVPQQGSQPGSQQPAPASYQSLEMQDASDGEGEDEEDDQAAPSEQGEQHGEQQAGAAPAGEGGGRKRRRRRRRGRRGGQRENGGPAHIGSGDAIEGVPVDMSVQDNEGDALPHAAQEAPALAAPLNSPSAPVWSLASEAPRAEPQHDETVAVARIDLPQPVRDEPVDAASAIAAEAVPTEAPARASDPEAPARKGWWQRPFRIRD